MVQIFIINHKKRSLPVHGEVADFFYVIEKYLIHYFKQSNAGSVTQRFEMHLAAIA
ncbi:MAG: hypothetical protein ACOC11_03395 [Prolixibacteraceae bacterium]